VNKSIDDPVREVRESFALIVRDFPVCGANQKMLAALKHPHKKQMFFHLFPAWELSSSNDRYSTGHRIVLCVVWHIP
jgi:hypothetical protein